MKFTDFLFSPGVRLTSILLGVLSGSVSALFLDWRYGVLIGAASALLLSLILPVQLYREELPYIRIKKTLGQPFLLDERVRFSIRNGNIGGYLILTEASMVLLSLEKGNHRLELQRQDVQKVSLQEDRSLHIFLSDTQLIRIRSAFGEDIYRVLYENGWGI